LTHTKETGIYAGSKIPHILKAALDRSVRNGTYLNESDFIRDAIKEKLEKEGFLVTSLAQASSNRS
jgi:Arc/MetJ-type ribon-helix-helix transcriptional regulator